MARKTTAPVHDSRFRDRIVELRRVKASDLRRHAKNYRTHDDRQRSALESMMTDIGFAGAALAYIEDGEIMLIDGHLRASIADDETVPVLITDLTREEAERVLATYDTIGSMAKVDGLALGDLIAPIDFDSRDLAVFLDDLVRVREEAEASSEPAEATHGDDSIAEMELQANEHYDYVVFVSRYRQDWHRLCGILDLDHVKKPRSKRIGLGRVVSVEKLLDVFANEYKRGHDEAVDSGNGKKAKS